MTSVAERLSQERDQLKITYESLSRLMRAERNPKDHDLGLLDTSMNRWGFTSPMLLDERTGRLVAGHGRLDTLQAKRAAGEKPPKGVFARDGDWWVPVIRGVEFDDDDEAQAYVVADNETTIAGGWNTALLADVLTPLAKAGKLSGTGYDEADVENMISALAGDPEIGVDVTKRPQRIEGRIDMIFTWGSPIGVCCDAVQAGLLYGVQSGSFRECPVAASGIWNGRHDIQFMDNNYWKYDHSIHLRDVSAHNPRYATVRDVMTKGQCKDAGIEYFDLDQILEWAEELSEHAENVIVIPKFDCIDQIPEKFMLGYSIPSSHGGTKLPVSAFDGRRTHLLGGSWGKQQAYVEAMGENVVSIDNNYIAHQSKYGSFCYPDGSSQQLHELGLGNLKNTWRIAMTISLSSIATRLGEISPKSIDIPDEAGESIDEQLEHVRQEEREDMEEVG